jgi:hypothetical protein
MFFNLGINCYLRILPIYQPEPAASRTSTLAGQMQAKSSNMADNRPLGLSEAGLSPASSTAQQLQQNRTDFVDLSRLEQLRVT